MSTRQEKICGLLKEEVSDILFREFKDPRLGFITVTDAEITPDLQHARIFVSVLGNDEERATNMAILKRSQHFVRQELKKRIHMKTLPDIEFKLDTTADQGIRIFELLEEIKHDEE
ncbi:MAG: 30S ribosome-binding factor RbfA [Armatimonadota bacterium]|nr:30S ribosome-binding factor RbfA [bacterium]